MVEILLRNVSKIYNIGIKKSIIFSNINYELTSDNIYFLVGSNGTGKTTLIKCILNLTRYNGEIVLSSDRIAYAPEKLLMPDYLTPTEFLLSIFKAKKYDEKKIENDINRYFKLFEIEKYRDIDIIKLSKGTRQKVNILQALIEEADIYIFDEPLSGLDENSKACFKKLIYNLRRKNKLVIISTHHLLDYHCRNKKIIEMGGR